MHYDCLSFDEIPYSSRLFLDFLASRPPASDFFATPAPLKRPIAEHSTAHRARVATALKRQNESFGASQKTLANIERLRAGTHAIVTGQQAGLMGGPLLSLLKAISAIKLADAHNAVPVFWIATTDHDLAEIDHAKFICDGKLTRVSATLQAKPGAMVSRSTIASDVVAALDACYAQPDPEARSLLADCYRIGERTGIAFARLWARLFADFGLVIIDPDDAELHEIAAPLYAAASKQSIHLNDALRARGKELTDAGYHEQVKVTDSTSMLFVDVEGVRMPIRLVRELTGGVMLRANGNEWPSSDALSAWIQNHSARITPNALLRPVVQDYLLPTLAYIGGPAEIAYFAQSTVAYDALLGGRTPILPRASATLIEPRIEQFLEAYGFSLKDLLIIHSQQDLALRMAEKRLPIVVTERFSAARERVASEFNSLHAAVRQEDTTLVGAAETALRKIQYQLTKLEERTARAHMRRESEIVRHAEVLWSNLRPEQQLQEREVSGAHFLLKYGLGFVQTLAQKLNPTCVGHQIIPF